ncbi:hypothetical protein KDW_00820 [Dictyobacter vulcani]|uniref:non-specific serine/threonine protein kinase n=1 Tax=Dictyobacter vulcani TaxID=2607529 RepID=A0A5J4KI63_9CHLR|nr:serine/threonine-protein kinase [Dictyobacter vulcani]GER85920.1 hypothetical protein KDW_00820 [Dictyobacter vulcani]
MVTDSNELLGQALGTCTLQRLLGRGGMGAVYLARQSRPRRIVAVKVLLPGIVLDPRSHNEFLARFRREADAIAALDHINIMPVYEYGEQGELAYLVMPYVTGGTLREVLEKRGILSLEEVVPIIEQAAAALDGAHAQSIVHRDLKPGNILFHADGRILLADFGLAKVLKDVTDQENTHGHLTSVGTIVGTPEYLSPEQGTGDTIDYRTDVYSLGVVLYQMLAGRVPFTGTSPVAVAIKHTLEQAPPITRFNPQVPKNVEAVVMKAMAKSPTDRFDSAGHFAQALRQAVAEALGDRFPGVAPSAFGEHITPVLPLTMEQVVENPPEKKTEDKEQPVEAVKPVPPTEKDRGTPITMSTMLMEEDKNSRPNQKTREATPHLSEHTQNRLQAFPTVITAMDDTVADQPRPKPLAVPLPHPLDKQAHTPAQQQTSREQPVRRQEYSTGQPNEWPRRLTTPEPQVQVYPEHHQHRSQPTGLRMPRYLIIAGAALALFVVLGGLLIFFSNQSAHTPNTQGAQQTGSIATSTAISKGTPGATQTPAIINATKPEYPLPVPKAPGNGTLIYGTNYPGSCDPKGGKWQNLNITAACGPDQLRLSNSGQGLAGTFLTQLPNSQTLPDSYYIQVEVKQNTPGSLFGVYYHKADQSSYNVMFDNNSWYSYFNKADGSPTQIASVALHGTEISGLTTVDILVQNNSFTYYINGEYQGHANSGFGGTDNGGEIGLTVAPGSDVSFQNLEIYTA